jgi:hypothetical protein
MSYLLGFSHVVFCLLSSYFLNNQLKKEPLYHFFWWGLFLKIILGVILVFVFRHLYGSFADSESIFAAASALTHKFYENPLKHTQYFFGFITLPQDYKPLFSDWTSQAIFMYKLTSLFCLLTNNNFWLVNIYLSVLSYLGLWTCGNAILKKVQANLIVVAIAFLAFPSVVLWSSGILKESFLWFFTGFAISLTLNTKLHKVLKYSLLAILLFCLLKLKYYYFAVLVPCILIYILGSFILQKSDNQKYSHKIILTFLAFMCLSFLIVISYFHDNLRLHYFFEGLAINYYFLANISDVDNLVYYGFTEPYWFSTLQNMPIALYNACFAPMLWQTHGNLLKIFAAIENTFVLLLLLSNLLLFITQKKKIQFAKNLEINLLLLCLLFYVIILATFIALATPNLGTLVRYKVGFLPFIIFVLLQNSINHLKKK